MDLTRHLTRTIAGLALLPLLAAGCDGGGDGNGGGGGGSYGAGEESSPSPTEEGGGTEEAQANLADVSEEFEPYSEGAAAVTYDEDAVPAGAGVELAISSEGADEGADEDADDQEGDDGGTEFSLRVTGLTPDRDYGAHMHTGACGEKPDDSGPHYQDQKDPEQPSSDPKYANDDNEVWLDFTTDSDGNADSDADVDWAPRSGEMKSLVIHDQHTKTGEGEAGSAGDRLACVNVKL
ncbi:superoxide dismutase family protein [Nocardiopsis sp. RSe5-2]|uniref:Superoxide dismutase family protein n=1 Tax=Nocardiopsis endophytica TaxID=3018445 RepID=A0ABT4UAZ8_9ACTN|nr:superoxide dismutase family protein [Nocardiopsis endophytica]MDA2814126.1 superoxide dismutase family protein [Nocardiopsis endophytica]